MAFNGPPGKECLYGFGESLTTTKLALDDNMRVSLFVRIAWIDLLDEGEASAAAVVAKTGPVVWV